MFKYSDENKKMNSIDMLEPLIPGGNDDKYRTMKPMQYPDILDHKEHVFDYDTRGKSNSNYSMKKIAKFLNAYGYGEEDAIDYEEMLKYLNFDLTKFPKKNGWWHPPHNFAINLAMMGLNLWRFTMLPMFPQRTAYRQKTDRLPEGIVIDPDWTDLPGHRDDLFDPTLENAKNLAKMAEKYPTMQETTKAELKWVEDNFKVKIPSEIASKLSNDSVKIATRRWGTNRLQGRKRILVPFDGSKQIELGSWD